MTGIYIHIPFCTRKCPYCDFYSLPLDRELKERYISALAAQIAAAPAVSADTVYFGGGTPSLLEPREVALLLDAAASAFQLSADCEITLETNPASCSLEKLRELRRAGVNRLSVGVQSLEDRVLSSLGRLHTAEEAREALEWAAKAGFSNLSADLMLATPGSSARGNAGSLRQLRELGVGHISAYLLKIMEGTPFFYNTPQLPGEEAAAEQYLELCREAEELGYGHYEISNFALPGRESRHNLKYWRLEDYLGFGPAAHSCFGGQRYSCPADIKGFIELWSRGGDYPGSLCSEGPVEAEDLIITALRTREGLDLGELRQRFSAEFSPGQLEFIGLCRRNGLAELEEGRLRLTDRGMLVSNSILTRLI